MLRFKLSPPGFKSCLVYPALPWTTYKLASRRDQCHSRRLKKISAGRDEKARALLPHDAASWLEPAKRLTRASIWNMTKTSLLL